MTFIEAISNCMRQYTHFEGRARRSEYWWFNLFLMMLQIVTLLLCSQMKI